MIEVPTGKFAGMAVVVDPGALGDDGPRPYVVTADRQARRLLDGRLPDAGRGGHPDAGAQDVQRPQSADAPRPGLALRDRTHGLHPAAAPAARRGGDAGRTAGRQRPSGDREIDRIRAELRAHPCHACPDREDHARWAERRLKLERDARTLQRRVEQRTNTIARQFDRVCEVLTALDYLEGDEVTEHRRHGCMRIYSDMDLVAAESMRHGLWDDLLALRAGGRAVGAGLRDAGAPTTPSRRGCPAAGSERCSARWCALWAELDALERENKLDYLREPDLGFAWAALPLGRGRRRSTTCSAETDLAAGDFVRWMKQLLDLADQVADAAGDGAAAQDRPRGGRRLRRGVVPTPRSPTDPVSRVSGSTRESCRPGSDHGSRGCGVRDPGRRGQRSEPAGTRVSLTGRFSYGVESTIVVRVETLPPPGSGPAGPRGRSAWRPGP